MKSVLHTVSVLTHRHSFTLVVHRMIVVLKDDIQSTFLSPVSNHCLHISAGNRSYAQRTSPNLCTFCYTTSRHNIFCSRLFAVTAIIYCSFCKPFESDPRDASLFLSTEKMRSKTESIHSSHRCLFEYSMILLSHRWNLLQKSPYSVCLSGHRRLLNYKFPYKNSSLSSVRVITSETQQARKITLLNPSLTGW